MMVTDGTRCPDTGFHRRSAIAVKLNSIQVTREHIRYFSEKFFLYRCGKVMTIHEFIGPFGHRV